MPDKFVPADTSGISPYFLKVRSYIYRFALKTTEGKQGDPQDYTSAEAMEKYLDSQSLSISSFSMLKPMGLKRTLPDLKTSGI